LTTGIVIPCYNESSRLNSAEVHFLAEAGLHVYLVDDGSTDDTFSILQALEGQKVSIIRLADNVGKGEAVRLGMQQAMRDGAQVVGYLDADFATSANEMLRLVARFKEAGVNVLLGSRWLHLGAHIERFAVRHYMGRVFATFASIILNMPVYDTQCGAKLFTVSDVLSSSLASPFASRWIFDVELLARLKHYGYSTEDFIEEPLTRWIDIGGSKVRIIDLGKVVVDLVRLWLQRL